ncbi:MAG: nucleoside 2-deoxyribosyltransferase [Candidatus Izemoplasmatales bacterium]|nr:nucleoside 2-deoxyribosyltransferase [Candidatus Izemoplasmatales bacterium]
MKEPLKIYFAGELFDHKHLTGNTILASYINNNAHGKYIVVLPQDSESGGERAEEIRNNDLRLLLESDLALFNFDGTDLDSGTVAEFMFAKMIDMPSVILRTDFRLAGDQKGIGDKWNLMCSFYPRTEPVTINAMELYQHAHSHHKHHHGEKCDCETVYPIDIFYNRIAGDLIKAFDKVRRKKSIFGKDLDKLNAAYDLAVSFPGERFRKACGKPAKLRELIDTKRKKGIY